MSGKRDRIFISYRRSDAAGSATAIRKTLLDQFGEGTVFRDVEGIDPGAEFPQALRDELQRAAVVVAVIGKGWLLAANEYGQRRIDFDDDWVRTELALALSDLEVTVIPVLVDGAEMPPASALPDSLKDLTLRNAVILRHDAWDDTARRLLDKVAHVLEPAAEPTRPAVPEALTSDLIRQVVTEALESVSQAGAQVLVATVDDISRIIAAMNARKLQSDEKATLELLLRRLVGRPVVRVAAYMQEVLRNTFSYSTSEGKWLGYALDVDRVTYGAEFRGCVLLLPGPSVAGRVAEVRGVAIVGEINFDYYGASSNEPPGPIVSDSPAFIEVGHKFGEHIS